jgi:hypothetical protein
MFDYAVHGWNARGYGWTNLTLYVVCVVAVAALALALGLPPPALIEGCSRQRSPCCCWPLSLFIRGATDSVSKGLVSRSGSSTRSITICRYCHHQGLSSCTMIPISLCSAKRLAALRQRRCAHGSAANGMRGLKMHRRDPAFQRHAVRSSRNTGFNADESRALAIDLPFDLRACCKISWRAGDRERSPAGPVSTVGFGSRSMLGLSTTLNRSFADVELIVELWQQSRHHSAPPFLCLLRQRSRWTPRRSNRREWRPWLRASRR